MQLLSLQNEERIKNQKNVSIITNVEKIGRWEIKYRKRWEDKIQLTT